MDKKQKLKKRSHVSSWTDVIYYVARYKLPITSSEDIGIYLMNHSGQEYEGIAYSQWLKPVAKPGFTKIKKIITFKQNHIIKVSFYNFPNNFYVDIQLSDLQYYQYSRTIRDQVRKYKEENAIQD